MTNKSTPPPPKAARNIVSASVATTCGTKHIDTQQWLKYGVGSCHCGAPRCVQPTLCCEVHWLTLLAISETWNRCTE
jgi:hypothetical protein